ncbi:zeta toxin family protein [Streptomyces sp. NPDC060028]|uniref:zeta toxin family protein n=1 Tax=Streptomyces sp. NPDC060028 TaxID=3347041 RepID=UPI0036C9694D
MVRARQEQQRSSGQSRSAGYKYKARWTYDERDIRRTGQAFAEMRLDLDDVVDVQLPAYRDFAGSDPEEWQRVDWRRRLVSWMFGLARHKVQDGIPFDEWNDSWKQVGANGLPGDLTWEEFVAASSRHRHSQNMGGKSRLCGLLLAVLARRGGAVLIGRDLYKKAHPQYDALMCEDDLTAGVRVRPDVPVLA